MKHLFRSFSLILLPLLLAGCSLPFFGSDQSALQVNSTPTASVFLNETHVGETPFFDENLKAGEYTIRLQVESDPGKTWQTKVNLSPKIVTVLERNFGETDDNSSHFLLQLEPITDEKLAEISVITIPDNVIVKVDGQPEGFSPLSLKEVTAGDHALAFVAPGYQELLINAQVREGYKLVVSSQLARVLLDSASNTASESGLLVDDATESAQPVEDEESVSPTSSVSPTVVAAKPTTKPSQAVQGDKYVKILETGTGWLRVRSEPTASADNEVGRVDVGETYPYLESNDTGWYKIEYEPGEEGWISGRYAEIFDN